MTEPVPGSAAQPYTREQVLDAIHGTYREVDPYACAVCNCHHHATDEHGDLDRIYEPTDDDAIPPTDGTW